MKITNTSLETLEEETVILRGQIETEEPWPYGYNAEARGARWQPTLLRARVRRYRRDGGEWSKWDVTSARMEGHRVKKDGSAGIDVDQSWNTHKPGTEVGPWLDAWVRNHPDLPKPVAAPTAD